MENSAHERIKSELKAMKAQPAGDIERSRAALDALLGRYPLLAGTLVEPAEAGGVPAEWVSNVAVAGQRTILHLHGGAYTRGSLVSARSLAARIAAASDARVLVIAYRLAPEHPCPAAVDDAVSAYTWLLESGVRPDQIVLTGDSAGGGLALASLLTLRDAGAPLPAGAALMSPWADLTGTSETIQTRAEAEPWLDPARLNLVARLYAGDVDLRDSRVSPLFADLHGMPPLLIQVGTDEILLHDSTALAERAEAAGVEVSLEVWDGMWHVFQAFAAEIPEGQEAIDHIGAFVRRLTSPANAAKPSGKAVDRVVG